jgi:hypothetical protein
MVYTGCMARNRAWHLKIDRLDVAVAALTAIATLFFEHVTHMPAVLAVYVLPPVAVVTWLKFRDHILHVPRENRSDDSGRASIIQEFEDVSTIHSAASTYPLQPPWFRQEQRCCGGWRSKMRSDSIS